MMKLVKGIDLFLLACHQSIINWLNQSKFKLALISGRAAGAAGCAALVSFQTPLFVITGVAIFLVVWFGSLMIVRHLESIGDAVIQRDTVIKIIIAVLGVITIKQAMDFILDKQFATLMAFFEGMFFMNLYYFVRCGTPKPKKKEDVNFSFYESM